jgi:hypothetical protein
MNVHSGNPCGGTSFPHPPDFTGFPIASHNPFGKFPPGGPLRPDPPSSAVGPQEEMPPGAAHCRVRRRACAHPPGPSASSTLPAPDWEAQGTERTEEKKRRQHRREGGDVGEGLVSSEPKRLPPHRTARALRSQSPGTRPVPPNPTTMETRGHQVLKLAHRIRGLLHDHNDPAHAGAVAFDRKRGFRLDRHGG